MICNLVRVGIAIFTVGASTAFAVDYFWDGSANNDWGNAANWTPAVVPMDSSINGPVAVFSLTNQTDTVNLRADRYVRGLRFQNTQPVVIQNNGAENFILEVGGGSPETGGGINVNSGSNVTISARVRLTIGQTWTNNSVHQFNVSGNILNGANALTIAGSGDTVLSGVVGGTTSPGAGGLIKTGAGTLTLTNSNTFGGGIFVYGGTVSAASDANLGGPTSNLLLNGGTLLTTAVFTSARPVILDGAGTINTGFNTTFNNGVGGAGSLTKIGDQILTLTADNGYTGGTSVNDGAIRFNSTEALPREGTHLVINPLGRAVLGSQGGSFLSYGAPHQVQWLNGGRLEFNNNSNNSVTDLAGSVVLSAESTIANLSSSFTSIGQITGPISGAARLNIEGVIQLASAGTHTGEVRIKSGGLLLAHQNALAGSTLHMIGGVGETGVLEFRGITAATFGSLVGSRGINLQNNLGQGVNLSIGANNSDNTYSGDLSGIGGSLTKIGTGTHVISGANSYTNGTFLNAGTLSIGSNSNLGGPSSGLAFNGGTLHTSFGVNSPRSVTITSAGSTIDTGGFNSIFSGNFSNLNGVGVLNKKGAGDLNLTGSNSYSGGTFINAGAINFATMSGSTPMPTVGNVTVASDAKIVLGTYGNYGSPGQQLIMNGGNLDLLDAGSGTLTSWGGGMVLNSDTTITRFGQPTVLGQIVGPISGRGGLLTYGAVKLLGNNSYEGGTTINAAGIIVGSDSNLGNPAGELRFAGGTLQTTAGISSSRPVVLTTSGAIDTNGFDSTFTGRFSGGGSLTKNGEGALTLTKE